MAKTFFDDLTRPNKSININGSTEYEIISFKRQSTANSLGEQLVITLVMNPGNVIMDFDVGEEVAIKIGPVTKEYFITDLTKSVNAESGWSATLMLSDKITKASRYQPYRPIKFMSLTYPEIIEVLHKANRSSLDFTPIIKQDVGNNYDRGWKASQVMKYLTRFMLISNFRFSGYDQWIKQVDVSGTFFEALTSLANKFMMKVFYISDSDTLMVINAMSARFTGIKQAPTIASATDITEEISFVQRPSKVILRGGQAEFNANEFIRRKLGFSVADPTCYYKNLPFGRVNTYLTGTMTSGNPDADPPIPPRNYLGTEEDNVVYLAGWAGGYKEESDGEPYIITKTVKDEIDKTDMTGLLAEGKALRSPYTEKGKGTHSGSLDLDGFKRTLTITYYSRDFFGACGPMLYQVACTYLHSVGGITEDDVTEIQQIDPRLIVKYTEEAFNYGPTLDVKYEGPRFYSPLLPIPGRDFLGQVTAARSGSYNLYDKSNNTYEPAIAQVEGDTLSIQNARHMPCRIKITYSRLPVQDDDTTATHSGNTAANSAMSQQLLPSEVEIGFIQYATEENMPNQGFYFEGDVVYESTLTYAPYSIGEDGMAEVWKPAKKESSTIYPVYPVNWAKASAIKCWLALVQPSQIVADETIMYYPMGDRKSYLKYTVGHKLEDGFLKPHSHTEYKIGEMPKDPLVKRKMDIELEKGVNDVFNSEFGISIYKTPPLVVEDPNIICYEDAERILHRIREEVRHNVVRRTYTFNQMLFFDVGWGVRFADIRVAPVPEGGLFGASAGQDVVIPGYGNQYGMITEYEMERTEEGAVTTITAELMDWTSTI